MPEQQRDENPSAPMVKRLGRQIRWDAAAAIIASLVGLLALVVAGYTAYIQRQQVRAQVWPYLLGGFSGGNKELIWINKGVGPAIIRNVEVSIDGKPQANWTAVFQTLHIAPPKFFQSTLNDNVISAGEKVDWLQFRDKADYDQFKLIEPRLHVKVCYCSTLGDCWIADSAVSGRTAVGTCPRVPASRQFND
ncbi:MAG: hypothetical protein EPN36_12975 [Rhodanobacteraceae bacterium]|nr:MAG: hypothetical protein EPN36_12975 [Rhodanobacteraceae bacterium]